MTRSHFLVFLLNYLVIFFSCHFHLLFYFGNHLTSLLLLFLVSDCFPACFQFHQCVTSNYTPEYVLSWLVCITLCNLLWILLCHFLAFWILLVWILELPFWYLWNLWILALDILFIEIVVTHHFLLHQFSSNLAFIWVLAPVTIMDLADTIPCEPVMLSSFQSITKSEAHSVTAQINKSFIRASSK